MGSLYVADMFNHVIHKYDPVSANVSIVAGVLGMLSGYTGDEHAATTATLCYPNQITGDREGRLFIADSYNNVIRKVDRYGMISTVVGTGIAGYTGDNLPAIASMLHYPTAVFIDNNNDDNENANVLLYVSDSANNVIRTVVLSSSDPTMKPSIMHSFLPTRIPSLAPSGPTLIPTTSSPSLIPSILPATLLPSSIIPTTPHTLLSPLLLLLLPGLPLTPLSLLLSSIAIVPALPISPPQ